MSFSETYASEVLQSRKIRAQRAGFWAKVISLLLMITLAAALRSEPQLRFALMGAATEAIVNLSGKAAPKTEGELPRPDGEASELTTLEAVMAKAQAEGQLPDFKMIATTASEATPTVKVNRPGAAPGDGPQFKSVSPQAQDSANSVPTAPPTGDASGMAAQLGLLLEQFGVGQ